MLSPGAAPVRPPLPGIEHSRIHTLRTIPDMDRILERLARTPAARAVVVGGGYIGLEMTEALRARDARVSLIELLPQVMAPADPEMVQPLHQELVSHGVDLRLQTAVTGFAARGDRIAVQLGDDEALEADLVVPMHMLGMGKAMIDGIMKQKGVEPLPGLIASASAAGLKLVVCTMSMDLMGFKREELLPEVEEGGVATYLDHAGEAGVNLFI